MLWVIALTFHTALRTGELLKLELQDFRFLNYHTGNYVVLTLREPKTRKTQPGLTQKVVFHEQKNLKFTSFEACVHLTNDLID